MLYQVGSLDHREKDDPIFYDLQAALTHAVECEREGSETAGIWTSPTEGNELVVIVRDGRIFWPQN